MTDPDAQPTGQPGPRSFAPTQAAGEPGPRSFAPEQAAGHPRVDAALAELDRIATLPPAEQVEGFAAVHRELQETLADIDGAAGDSGRVPAAPDPPDSGGSGAGGTGP